MDRIITVTLGIIVLLIISLAGTAVWESFADRAYHDTVKSTYNFTLTLTSDAPLYNATFFIPVPADSTGNSPVVDQFNARTISGIPADWDYGVYDTGKATLLKISAPAIIPPGVKGQSARYRLDVIANISSPSAIETINPAANGSVFRPVMDIRPVSCPTTPGVPFAPARCVEYTTSLYADYTTVRETQVNVDLTLEGRNSWQFIQPAFNGYYATASSQINGENHGWVRMDGVLYFS